MAILLSLVQLFQFISTGVKKLPQTSLYAVKTTDRAPGRFDSDQHFFT
jgi:hypothetical protein